MVKNIVFKKLWVSLVFLAFLALVIGVVGPNGSAARKVGPQVGYQAPDFKLDSLISNDVQLNRIIKANKVTLINFWGIWCPYCVREIPELVGFYQQYHQRRVEILAVDVGDNPQKVPAFVRKNKMTFPVLIDKNNRVNALYQISGFPTTIIVDRQGMIREMIVGATNQAVLAAKVEPLLKED
jgi:cytochrome c biogenesis protein CcmG/thiol:disulfide interchange protein DsbE